tara:strand:- start:183 stop:869 length:687 start_codon:yes stop_codon:yes gene_type:complete
MKNSILIFFLLALISCKENKSIKSEYTYNSNYDVLGHTTIGEYNNFRDSILSPELRKIRVGKTNYPIINTELKKRLNFILINYSEGLLNFKLLDVSKNSHILDAENAGFVFPSSRGSLGPEIKVNVWELFKQWEQINNTEVYQNFLIASVLHEYIHFDKDNLGMYEGRKSTYESRLKEEVRAWSTMFDLLEKTPIIEKIPLHLQEAYKDYKTSSKKEFTKYIENTYLD